MLCLFTFPVLLQAQEPPETSKQLFQAPQTEKVYLHLDRNTFLPGDTVWAKAYLWYGYEQLPDTASRVLHLELFDAQGKVLQNKKLLIENGIPTHLFCATAEGPGDDLKDATRTWNIVFPLGR